MNPVRTACFTAALLIATSASAQRDVRTFSGGGQHDRIDCAGGGLEVTGARNSLTITGACNRLVVTGAANEIRVAMAAGGRISVTGAANDIRWTAPRGTRVRVNSTGYGHRVARGN